MKRSTLRGFLGYSKERLSDIPFLIISILYLGFCLFSSVRWMIGGIAGHVILSSGFLLFIPAMLAVEYLFGMRFGPIFMVAALSIAVGAILGSPFGMYSALPMFDDILHTLSGFVFAALGLSLAEFFFGRARGGRKFAGSLVFAAAFSLGLAVLWELWEFGGMLLLGMETADDTLIDGFTSFFFTSRSEAVVLDGITKTVIYYGDGLSLTVDGYLDIGYFDTLNDMIVCTIGTVAFTAFALVGRLKLPWLERALVPSVRTEGEREDASEKTAEDTCTEGLSEE